MVAHVDMLTPVRGSEASATSKSSADPSQFCLTVSDDSESSVYELFERYWDFVLLRQRLTAAEKTKLLAPLLAEVQQYRNAFFGFCASWNARDEQRRLETIAAATSGVDASGSSDRSRKNQDIEFLISEDAESRDYVEELNRLDLQRNLSDFTFSESGDATIGASGFAAESARLLREEAMRTIRQEWPEVYNESSMSMQALNQRAWTQTIPGQLEARLKDIISAYTVFTFYGSGYDHVLLLSYLVPRLFELGFAPKIERRGNKITSISTKCGIVFRDVTKLLAPSMNLRRFGALFGLEQKKAHFPFALLRSVKDLDIPGLPEEASDPSWFSSLSSSAPSQSDVDEAIALYRQESCSNLGDYLRAYLRLDVEILQKATVAWKEVLFDLVGLDFVDARRFTISSLSYDAGLRVWEKNLRIGCFFPNNSQHYRLLRLGMRGGLCSVFRTVAGGDDDDDDDDDRRPESSSSSSSADAESLGQQQQQQQQQQQRSRGKPWFISLGRNSGGGGGGGGGGEDYNDEEDEDQQQQQQDFSRIYKNNAHWLNQQQQQQQQQQSVSRTRSHAKSPEEEEEDEDLVREDRTKRRGGASRYVGYYDAVSLYPSSGK